MKILTNIFELNKAINNHSNLGFVPTMGGLHNGHISLIKISKNRCSKTLVSIYVNPNQFNNKKDFAKYPRNIKNDFKILYKLKVDYLFIPKTSEIYKKKRNKKIKLNKNDKIMCGKYRKGHFEGVLDIMDRFLRIIKAKYIFMGEKDYQQLYLIKNYIKKKYKSVVINCPTIRDKNKLALSSRNFLLSKKEHYNAGLISKFLIKFKISFSRKKNKNYSLLIQIKNLLEEKFRIRIEYLEFRNTSDLKISNFKKKYKLFIAYYINNIRLIDNF